MQAKLHQILSRADHLEMRLCILLNSSSRKTAVRLFFRAISRMGDGVLWYTLAAFLPYLYGMQGLYQLIHIMLTALVVLIVYKFLKQKLVRERPFINCDIIQQAAPALDRYSFPSGHTMHAFSFSIMFRIYLPQIAYLVWGFTSLVALSRVILGLHYPTDVFAGALLGSILALSSAVLITL